MKISYSLKYLILLMYVAIPGISQIPLSGMVGGWVFSGNANDISGNNNHGSVSGASLTTDRFNNNNSAYRFNGSSDYIIMSSAGPSGSSSRSVSFWFKTSSNALMCAFDYGTIFSGGVFHIMFNYSCTGAGIDMSNQALVWSNSQLNDNKWHHMVVVYDSLAGAQMNDVDFYVDGSLLSIPLCSISGSTQVINTGITIPITIGKTAGLFSRFFDGVLDDYFVYDRALTTNEILDLYNYSPCEESGNVQSMSGPATICPGSSSVFSISPVKGAISYSWTLPVGWSGSSFTHSIQVFPANSSGIISVASSNTCNTIVTSSLLVKSGGPLPQIIVSSVDSLICAGSSVFLASGGAMTYTWTPGNLNGFLVQVSPLVSTTYTVAGSNSAGCVGTAVFTQQVEVCNSIPEEFTESDVIFFPNPVNDKIILKTSDVYAVRIYDLNGQLLVDRKIEHFTGNVEVGDLQPGRYTMLFNGKSKVGRIIFIKY